jgi:hypothetical protein
LRNDGVNLRPEMWQKKGGRPSFALTQKPDSGVFS